MSDNPVPPVTTTMPPTTTTPPPTPAEVIDQSKADITTDVAAVESAASSVVSAARAQYDTLKPEAQAAFHEMLNTLEARYGSDMGAIHSMFGAK